MAHSAESGQPRAPLAPSRGRFVTLRHVGTSLYGVGTAACAVSWHSAPQAHSPLTPFPLLPMGLLDFLKDAGKDLFGGKSGNEAEEIKNEIERALGDNISNLGVRYDNGKVTLQGTAKSVAAKEKAALIAGNVKGVASVDDNGITVSGAQTAGSATAAPAASRYYTIQSGDTLSKIAKEHYGDANAYNKIFEANREVIGDPDKIYPGQRIRIPAA